MFQPAAFAGDLEQHRLKREAFDTEIPLRRKDFPAETVDLALRHTEARTYQFVVQAYPRTPPSSAAFLPSFEHKLIFFAANAAPPPERALIEQTRRLAQDALRPHRNHDALTQRCAMLENRVRRYESLPFMKTVLWLRRKLLRLHRTK